MRPEPLADECHHVATTGNDWQRLATEVALPHFAKFGTVQNWVTREEASQAGTIARSLGRPPAPHVIRWQGLTSTGARVQNALPLFWQDLSLIPR